MYDFTPMTYFLDDLTVRHIDRLVVESDGYLSHGDIIRLSIDLLYKAGYTYDDFVKAWQRFKLSPSE